MVLATAQLKAVTDRYAQVLQISAVLVLQLVQLYTYPVRHWQHQPKEACSMYHYDTIMHMARKMIDC